MVVFHNLTTRSYQHGSWEPTSPGPRWATTKQVSPNDSFLGRRDLLLSLMVCQNIFGYETDGLSNMTMGTLSFFFAGAHVFDVTI
jgi:hypothetical protein